MDYLEKIRIILNTLEKNGHINDAERIKMIRDSASGGSELIMSVTHELLLITRDSIELQKLIGRDVTELKDFCWSIGLMVL